MHPGTCPSALMPVGPQVTAGPRPPVTSVPVCTSLVTLRDIRWFLVLLGKLCSKSIN